MGPYHPLCLCRPLRICRMVSRLRFENPNQSHSCVSLVPIQAIRVPKAK
jgi:hypothetical protein